MSSVYRAFWSVLRTKRRKGKKEMEKRDRKMENQKIKLEKEKPPERDGKKKRSFTTAGKQT